MLDSQYVNLFDAFVFVDRGSLTLHGNEAGRALRAWADAIEVTVTVMSLARTDPSGRVILWDCLEVDNIHVHLDEK